MIRILLVFLVSFFGPFFIIAQNEEVLEYEVDTIGSSSDFELKNFYNNFDTWIKAIEKGSPIVKPTKEKMINNFIIFSEDGLIMKDLDFHSVENCKEQLLAGLLKRTDGNKNQNYWIYVGMESQVNKKELTTILKFLKNQKIQYLFAQEEEIISSTVNK